MSPMQLRTDPAAPLVGPDEVTRAPKRTSADWFPGLQGLRGILLLVVFALHLPPPYIPPLHGGYIMMEVFFVLSGFLITTILFREYERTGRIRLRSFYARRAIRLLPAVVLFVAVVYAATYLDPVLRSRGADTRRHAIAGLSYVYNWIAIYSFNRQSAAPGFVAHLWSLSVEEQFYFVWPLAMFAILRRVTRRQGRSVRDAARAMIPWLIGGILASNFLRTMIGFVWSNGSSYSRANWGTDTRASGMLLGALVAVIRLGLPVLYQRGRKYLPVAGCIALGIWVPALWLYPREPNRFPFAGGYLVTELCGVVMVLALVERSIRPFNWLCETPVLQWLGKISYTGYVVHFMVIGRFTAYARPFRFEWPTVFALTLVLSGLSFHLVEQPFARWARARFALVS